VLFDKKPFTFDSVFRNILKISGVVLALIIMHYLRNVLVPFAIALVLAYLNDPIVQFFQSRVKSRPLAVLLTLTFIILFTAALFAFIIPALVSEVSYVAQLTTDLVNDSQFAATVSQYLPQGIWQAIKDWVLSPEIQRLMRAENIFAILDGVAKNILPGAWGLIAGTANILLWILGLAFVILYLVFMLLDFDKLRAIWKDLLPPAYREEIVDFIHEFNGALHRYFRAQSLIAGIVGILFAIGFEVIGLPMGVVLGLFVGALNLIPYLQTIGLIPAFLLAILHALQTGSSVWLMVGLTALVFAVVQTIQETLLIPYIMKRNTGLSPAIVLLSLTIWAKILGFLGLILALPLTYLIYTYYMRYLAGISDITYSPEVREIRTLEEKISEKAAVPGFLERFRAGRSEDRSSEEDND